jgi:hypothetical protein
MYKKEKTNFAFMLRFESEKRFRVVVHDNNVYIYIYMKYIIHKGKIHHRSQKNMQR